MVSGALAPLSEVHFLELVEGEARRSPVEWEEIPTMCPSIHIRPFIFESQVRAYESQTGASESQTGASASQTGASKSVVEPLRAWMRPPRVYLGFRQGGCMYGTDGRKELLPILEEFVPFGASAQKRSRRQKREGRGRGK